MAQPTRRLPQRIVIPVNPAELGYLAGIIDGEGSIFRNGHHPQRPRWILDVANTDWSLIEWLLSLGGTCSEANRPPRRTVYHWKVCSRADVEALLTAIEPLLRIKRGRARECLDELLALELAPA